MRENQYIVGVILFPLSLTTHIWIEFILDGYERL